MSDYTHTGLELVGRHVPEPMVNAAGNAATHKELGHDATDPVTGMYEIGVLIEGAFVPIMVEKASLVYDRIQLAKDSAPEPEENAPVETGPQSDLAAGEPGTSEHDQG